MPIVIRELHIKVAVNAPNEQNQSNGNAPQNSANTPAQGGDDDDKEAIIAECVEQVMEILRNRQEP
ncbi:MAG: DUF5908 family protein [Spirosomataceae bacterium]